jgi:nitrogen regulatory protein P-II 1
VEVLVADPEVDKIIELIGEAAKTGKIGDGKIWAVETSRVMRVRTGEMGEDAL